MTDSTHHQEQYLFNTLLPYLFFYFFCKTIQKNVFFCQADFELGWDYYYHIALVKDVYTYGFHDQMSKTINNWGKHWLMCFCLSLCIKIKTEIKIVTFQFIHSLLGDPQNVQYTGNLWERPEGNCEVEWRWFLFYNFKK